jgi:hypothetical protein
MEKPGIKTTEFWITSIVNIVMAVMAILAVRGLVSEQEADLYTTLAQAVIATVAPLVIAFTSGRYINSRAQVKTNK